MGDETVTAEMHENVQRILRELWPRRSGGVLSLAEVAQRCGVTKGAAGKWQTSRNIPRRPARDKLIRLVASEISPQASEELAQFYEVLATAQAVTTSRRLAAAAVGPRAHDRSNKATPPLWLYRIHEHLVLEGGRVPSIAELLENGSDRAARRWQLGSSEFSGHMPAYVARSIDIDLDAALGRPANRFLVISGSPKSGKTRSAIEALNRNGSLRVAELHELRPPSDGMDVLGAYAKAVLSASVHLQDRVSMERFVVLIDDLHAHLVSTPDGRARGSSIQMHVSTLLRFGATVVATSLPFVLDVNPRFVGLSDAEQQWIREHTLVLNDVLDDDEYERATELLGQRHVGRLLGARLAGIDELRRQVGLARSLPSGEWPYRSAVLNAICEASLLWPKPPRPSELVELSAREAASPFAESRLRDAVDWMTSPLNEAPTETIARYDPRTDRVLLSDALRRELLEGHEGQLGELNPGEELTCATRLLDLHLDDAASRRMRSSADRGNALAMCNLGTLQAQDGRVRRDDPDGAFAWWLRSAEAGFPGAMHSIGLMLEEADVLDGIDGAISWYRRAADLGHGAAANCLGVIRYKQGLNQDDDSDGSVSWWRRGAAVGDLNACYNLGVLRAAQGRTEDQDPDGAISWYREAAGRGHLSAMTNLGSLRYDEGRSDDSDDDGAIYWWKRAAAMGSAMAMFNLGVALEHRDQVEDDASDDAVTWFRQAADNGYEPAAVKVAEIRAAQGRISPEDPDGEVVWRLRARVLTGLRDAQNLEVTGRAATYRSSSNGNGDDTGRPSPATK